MAMTRAQKLSVALLCCALCAFFYAQIIASLAIIRAEAERRAQDVADPRAGVLQERHPHEEKVGHIPNALTLNPKLLRDISLR